MSPQSGETKVYMTAAGIAKNDMAAPRQIVHLADLSTELLIIIFGHLNGPEAGNNVKALTITCWQMTSIWRTHAKAIARNIIDSRMRQMEFSKLAWILAASNMEIRQAKLEEESQAARDDDDVLIHRVLGSKGYVLRMHYIQLIENQATWADRFLDRTKDPVQYYGSSHVCKREPDWSHGVDYVMEPKDRKRVEFATYWLRICADVVKVGNYWKNEILMNGEVITVWMDEMDIEQRRLIHDVCCSFRVLDSDKLYDLGILSSPRPHMSPVWPLKHEKMRPEWKVVFDCIYTATHDELRLIKGVCDHCRPVLGRTGDISGEEKWERKILQSLGWDEPGENGAKEDDSGQDGTV